MTAISRGVQYIKRVIGSHNVSAPMSQWNKLNRRELPYLNNLFEAKKIGNTIEFRTDYRATPSLMMAELMKGHNCHHREFNLHNQIIFADLKLNEQLSDEKENELYTLDTLENGIPGRWACMLHDFKFKGNSYVTKNEEQYKPQGELTTELIAETMLSRIDAKLTVRTGPLVPDNFEPSQIAKDIFKHQVPRIGRVKQMLAMHYGGYWITGDGMCTPSVEYFMHRTRGLKSFGEVEDDSYWHRYHSANKWEGGIYAPTGYFSEAYIDFNPHRIACDHDDKNVIVRGWNDYSTNFEFPFEEMVVLEEAIKSCGGRTYFKITPGRLDDMATYRDIKGLIEYHMERYDDLSHNA